MEEIIELTTILPVKHTQLYMEWLNSEKHSAFTGGEAIVDPKTGGTFTAWDGYISGKTIDQEPFLKIVQKWRTTEFSEEDKDSLLKIYFEDVPEGTRLTLVHKDLPEGQGERYKKGWEDHYFEPMKKYYGA